MDSMAYSQGVGSVPYGLPCVAVTRRNQVLQYQQYEQERINLKLCQVMRVPADFVDVEQESDDESETTNSEVTTSAFEEFVSEFGGELGEVISSEDEVEGDGSSDEYDDEDDLSAHDDNQLL